ncbi:MAG: ATP-binding cassette domain-containing protein [Actinomyces sp.]|nr:ATP-binding cassette domain-containing protein [Actinomyces sp.]MDO4899686.1 ATP-binding cassette domain-containing protein [Actinomyces sp.]
MLKGAGVILLDEATAFLDPESERGVEEALADLRRHATVVTIAHRLGSVTDYDQIAYVNHGKIIDVGAHPELLKRCREYAELWSAYQQAQGWHLASNSDLKAATPRRQGGANANPVANSPRSHHLRRDTRGEVDTPTVTARVRGLSKLGTVKQWLSLLGAHRQDLWRRGIWWIMLDGVLGSAPLVIVLLALLEVLGTGVSADSWWRFGLPLLAIFAARWLVGVALSSTWWKSANAAIAALRRGVLTHLRRIPLGEYARLDVGRNATLVNSDLPLVDFTNLPAKVMQGVIQPLLAGAVLMILDWQLAFAALSGLPIFLLLLRLSDRAQRTVLGEVTRERSQATSDLLELVHGTAVLRANPDAPQVSRYHAAVERLRRASVAMAVRTSPLSSLASVALELGFGVLVLLVSVRTTNQTLSQDVAILLLVASLNLYRPYQELMDLSSYRHLQSHIVTRLAEIWDVDPMPDTPSGTAANAAVEMHDVGFSYEPDRPILVNVSFLAQPGEITALVGPSGAGKSTVTNLIARFWDVDSGSVTIGRCDVRELGQEELSDLVTTVYQDVYLFPSTVRENLSMGTDVDDARLEEALRAAQAWDFVDKLPDGLDSELTEGGLNLSGGQRQRLAIARALVKDAPILLLDEAVAAVDPQTEVRIQEALGNLVQERTVIVVAHRLNTVKQVDQIVVLDDHIVEAVGTHTELLASSPTYHRLWEANKATSR